MTTSNRIELTPSQRDFLIDSLRFPSKCENRICFYDVYHNYLSENEIINRTKNIVKLHPMLNALPVLVNGSHYQDLGIENENFEVKIFNQNCTFSKAIIEEFIQKNTENNNLNQSIFILKVLKFIDEKMVLIISANHVFFDGFSANFFFKLFRENFTYTASQQKINYTKELTDFSNKFNDHTIASYWKKKLENDNLLNNRNILSSNKNVKKKIVIDQKLSELIKSYAYDNNISLNTCFKGVYGYMIMLYTYADKNFFFREIVYGRSLEEPNLMGAYILSLPIIFNQGTFNKENTLNEYFYNIHKDKKNTIDTKYFSLLDQKKIIRNEHISFFYNNRSYNTYEVNQKKHYIETSLSYKEKEVHFSIEEKEGFILYLNYNTNFFDGSLFLERLKRVLEQISLKKVIFFKDIDLRENKAGSNLSSFNYNVSEINFIHKYAKKTPNAIALCIGEEQISYKELSNLVNKVAIYIENNINDQQPTGVLLDNSKWSIITILSILSIGRTYVPIDINNPKQRINYIIKSSGITNAIFFDGPILNDVKMFNVSQMLNEDYSIQPFKEFNVENNAYIIFTSGSTGNPKGVKVTYNNILNLLINQPFNFTSNDRWLLMHSLAFDFAVWEVLGCLFHGATLYIEEDKSPDLIVNSIFKNKITVLNQVPTFFAYLFDEIKKNKNKIVSLKYIIFGGESPNNKILLEFKKMELSIKLINMYGITETTVHVTHKDLSIADLEENCNNVGKCLTNYTINIQSPYKQVLPNGLFGEITVSGLGVSNGYINNQSLNEKRFIIKNNIKTYFSGDLGLINAFNETIVFGRNDHQIKIRGYRIELSEIKNALFSLKYVERVELTTTEEQHKEIAAFLILKYDVEVSVIREELIKIIPKYMIPSYIVRVADFPKTINGKIDIQQLLLQIEGNKKVDFLEEILTDTEKEVLKYWTIILKSNTILKTDNFFEIGGNSLSAINLIHLMKDSFSLEMNDIFLYPTIEQLAERINQIKINNQNETIIEVTTENKGKESIRSKKVKYIKKANAIIHNLDCEKIQDTGNILLLGGTGFLGIHLLNQLLKETKYYIFLIVRSKDKLPAQDRVKRLYNRFFENFDDIKERICILTGEITKRYFGVEKDVYENLKQNVGIVINSSANVKHYGTEESFKKINVDSIHNILAFCDKNKSFHHISTMGIATSGEFSSKKNIFTDNDCDLGQHYSNLYVKTKFQAEKLIKESDNTLFYNIHRVGNLAFDSESGCFQENINENAFFNSLKLYLKLGICPDFDDSFDFSFVNETAFSITAIIKRNRIKNQIFHIQNPNQMSNDEFLTLLKECSYPTKKVSMGEFQSILKENDEAYNQEISKLLLYFGYYDKNNFSENKVYSTKTLKLFEKMNVKWSTLEKNTLQKVIDNMKEEKFI